MKTNLTAALTLLAVFSASTGFAANGRRGATPEHRKETEKDASGRSRGEEKGKEAIREANRKAAPGAKVEQTAEDLLATAKLAELIRKELGNAVYPRIEEALSKLKVDETTQITSLVVEIKSSSKTNAERLVRILDATTKILADPRVGAKDFNGKAAAEGEAQIAGDKEAEEHSLAALEGTPKELEKNKDASLTGLNAFYESYRKHWLRVFYNEARAAGKDHDTALKEATKRAKDKLDEQKESQELCKCAGLC